MFTPESLVAARKTIRFSQSKLARLAGLGRFKIAMFEIGDGSLSPDEQERIRQALQSETERLRALPDPMEFGRIDPASSNGGRAA